MILLNKASSNNVIVTLSEKISTFSNVIFWFKNYQSKQVITVPKGATSDVTINDYPSGTTGASGPTVRNERYYNYVLTAYDTTNFEDGWYDYVVYGTSDSIGYTGSGATGNPVVIDTSTFSYDNILETGKAYVNPTDIQPQVTYGPTANNPIVYVP